MVFAISYGLGASALLALVFLMLINRRPQALGWGIFFACVATLIWAVAAAIQRWWIPGFAHAAESLSFGAWVFLLVLVLVTAQKDGQKSPAIKLLAAGSLLLAVGSFLNDLRFLQAGTASYFLQSQIFARIAVAVCGILLIENLFRNTASARRWHVYPFCIAVGFLFAYNLFAFSEAVVLKSVDPTLLAGRGIVLVLIVPLLALTMARNAEWQIDVHVSRKVVFHGATFTAAGIFLLLTAGVASFIGRLSGDWAAISKISFFSGSLILLLTVLSTGTFRARLQRVISENFFTARYDYRVEWLRSISTLCGPDEVLSVRAIRAIADVVDSPGGILYLKNAAGDYAVAQMLGQAVEEPVIIPRADSFVEAFKNGKAVQILGSDSKSAANKFDGLWLAIPLTKTDCMMGFVVLSRARAPVQLNWESFDLLLAIGQQVAAFLAEEIAARRLVESQALIEYSKKFTFVAHDIKNVAGQLGMMVANVQRFGEVPAFRADLVRSIENSVAKLNGLLARLRFRSDERDEPHRIDPVMVVREVAAETGRADIPVSVRSMIPDAQVYIAPSVLHSILTHVINNSTEASSPGDVITIEVSRRDGNIVIDIIDEGCGMSSEFLRDRLFTPGHTTKADGHGMGAFQARELVRAAGGDMTVASKMGSGTRMSIILPDCAEVVTDLPRSRALVG